MKYQGDKQGLFDAIIKFSNENAASLEQPMDKDDRQKYENAFPEEEAQISDRVVSIEESGHLILRSLISSALSEKQNNTFCLQVIWSNVKEGEIDYLVNVAQQQH